MNLGKCAISFLGAGNMAEALIGGLLSTGIFTKERVFAADVQPERLQLMQKKFGIVACRSNLEAVKKGDILLLAVKPQNVKELMGEVGPELSLKKLVISIAAGVRTGKLEQLAGKELRLVRVMPNMPALVKAGISVYFCGKNAEPGDGKAAAQILSGVGNVLPASNEEILDAVTALSGSGPAYFFYFIESLIQAGEALGLPPAMASQLVMETAEGSVKLLKETKEHPAELRRKVTSPGGTTAAAQQVFEESGFSQLVTKALKAAENRSRELSR